MRNILVGRFNEPINFTPKYYDLSDMKSIASEYFVILLVTHSKYQDDM